MNRNHQIATGIVAGVVGYVLFGIAYSWTPIPVVGDRNVFMPGSQPGDAALEKVDQCSNCHGGFSPATEPVHNWHGSMMSQAARDPLWLASLAVADQDSIWALGNANAGDLCLRCHTPSGWMAGRSDPPNASALTTQGSDFEGVNCAACHRMLDAFTALEQQPELPAETDATGIAAAAETKSADLAVLSSATLFDGVSPFLDSATDLPVHVGDGEMPNYIEATGGQYFFDPEDRRRGPRWDVNPNHQWQYSRYHKSKHFCATCHDVSNPALANVMIAPAGAAERQAAGSYFHLERTWSEFLLSDYGADGGAPTAPSFQEIGVETASKCQDCHMRDVTGKAAKQNKATMRNDLALHDQTGGNTWLSRVLATVDSDGPVYDAYNHAILSGTKYAGASIDLAGLQGVGQALLDGETRARDMLQRAARLDLVDDMSHAVAVRIVNQTGHKLISGFPEGRRMWLNVVFYNAAGQEIGVLNEYEPLVTSVDGNGNEQYVSGGVLTVDRDDLVYEAQMSSSLTGEAKSFHMVLATDRYKDNRIPPKGFLIGAAADRLVQPRWPVPSLTGGEDAPEYFTAEEYTGGYDEVVFAKPTGTAGWVARLYYQTTSKEYVEFLRDEIDGTATTLSSPTLSGETQAYIVQSDPFFATLKGWGSAIWDLWLHNSGAAPVLMTGTISPPYEMSLAQGPGAGEYQCRFATIAGWEYQVEWSPDLTEDSWEELGDPVTGDGEMKTVIDSTGGGASPGARRFYRVVTTTEP